MKKIFLFSLRGIVYAFSEEGVELLSRVTVGFLQFPLEKQRFHLKEVFRETLLELQKYRSLDVVFVNTISDKKDLKEVIQKKILFNKENFSNNHYKYWEKELLEVDSEDFDKYNKEIFE